MANTHKYVYLFSEGNGSMRELLGGKGANLAEMTNLGMPVPQAHLSDPPRPAPSIITTAARSTRTSRPRSTSTWARWRPSVARSSPIPRTPCWFPCAPAPAPPCPGMMDTILNLGLNAPWWRPGQVSPTIPALPTTPTAVHPDVLRRGDGR